VKKKEKGQIHGGVLLSGSRSDLKKKVETSDKKITSIAWGCRGAARKSRSRAIEKGLKGGRTTFKWGGGGCLRRKRQRTINTDEKGAERKKKQSLVLSTASKRPLNHQAPTDEKVRERRGPGKEGVK